jgi:hypothetical protein
MATQNAVPLLSEDWAAMMFIGDDQPPGLQLHPRHRRQEVARQQRRRAGEREI